jgi:hypothetical protein
VAQGALFRFGAPPTRLVVARSKRSGEGERVQALSARALEPTHVPSGMPPRHDSRVGSPSRVPRHPLAPYTLGFPGNGPSGAAGGYAGESGQPDQHRPTAAIPTVAAMSSAVAGPATRYVEPHGPVAASHSRSSAILRRSLSGRRRPSSPPPEHRQIAIESVREQVASGRPAAERPMASAFCSP